MQGGCTFGVVNSLGAYFSLAGIGLLYARTGAARPAAARPPRSPGTAWTPLVLAALVLI